MKKLFIALFVAFSLSTSAFACDDLGGYVIETPKGNFFGEELKYIPETHEWMVSMAEKIDGPYFVTLLPCNWVKIYDPDGEVTEEMAKKWGK